MRACGAALATLALTMVAQSFMSTTASALSIDYRHEYVDVDQANKGRVMISDRLKNGIGYSVETKMKSGGHTSDRPFSELESNGAEFSLTYQYKVLPNFSIQPGMNLEVGSGQAIYKPSFRVQYNFDNGIYVAARYRYEFKNKNGSDTKEDGPDEHVNRLEGWLGYKTGDWTFESNYIWRSSNQIRFNNTKQDYEYDFKVAYNVTPNWQPFVQIGNIKVDSTTDDRQTRFRVGLKYSY